MVYEVSRRSFLKGAAALAVATAASGLLTACGGGKGLYMEGSKVVTTFAYNGKKAVFTDCDGGDFTSKVE